MQFKARPGAAAGASKQAAAPCRSLTPATALVRLLYFTIWNAATAPCTPRLPALADGAAKRSESDLSLGQRDAQMGQLILGLSGPAAVCRRTRRAGVEDHADPGLHSGLRSGLRDGLGGGLYWS